MYKPTKIIAAAAMSTSLASSIANAGGTTVYQDRTLFNNNTGALQIEDFESEALGEFAPPTTFDSGLGVNLFAGSVLTSIEAGDPDGFVLSNTTPGGRKYMRFGDFGDTGSYTVEFSVGSAVSAFGFDISGFQPGAGAGGLNLTLYNNGQLAGDMFIGSNVDWFAQFIGVTTDFDFDMVRVNIPVNTFNGTPQADISAFDDIVWSVPAPSSAALLALSGALATRRRR